MARPLIPLLARELEKLRQAGLYRNDTVSAPAGQARVIDLTGHDYLGLSRDPRVREAAVEVLASQGAGVCSARMIGGAPAVHRELAQRLGRFLGAEAAALYGSAYLANLGLFLALFDDRDSVFCDSLIHSSLAEGVRLCGARTYSYLNNDVDDLEDKLKRSRAARFRAIVTDGVFPFDGTVADLGRICDLADRFEAIVVVDDSLGVGVLGRGGRGACELRGVIDRVDLVTGSLSKALGGFTGGFAAGRGELIQWLQQKSTPYLFSSAPSPAMAAGALAALKLLEEGDAPLEVLWERVAFLRRALEDRGLSVLPGEHPIVAVMVGEVVTLQRMVNLLHERRIQVHGLCYPVVPEREARVRLHVTALHTEDELQQTASAFASVGREVGALDEAGAR